MSSDLNICVCTIAVPGIHMYVHVTSLFVQFDTFKMQFPLRTHLLLLRTRLYPFMIAIYSAYVQESANWYIHASEQSVTIKNGSVHMVSFPVTFLPKSS